jgi:hypothetical protein
MTPPFFNRASPTGGRRHLPFKRDLMGLSLSLSFLTSALDGDEWSASRLSRFTSRERAPSTHCTGGWVGPRVVLDAVVERELLLLPATEPRPSSSLLYRLSSHESSAYLKGQIKFSLHKDTGAELYVSTEGLSL